MATAQDWDDFSERKPNRNIGLVVEARTFWISKEALADFSPVFLKMFYGDFQESGKDRVQLPEKKADEILEMLRCLFQTDGHLKKVDTDNVVSLIKLADEYQIRFLECRCDEVIGSLVEGHSVIKDLFVAGVEYRLKKVVRACLPMIARFDLDELQPILDNSSMEVKSAILWQIINQASGSHSGYCQYGRCSAINVITRCMSCPTCTKPTNMRSGQTCCRCLAPRAAAELEKIGL